MRTNPNLIRQFDISLPVPVLDEEFDTLELVECDECLDMYARIDHDPAVFDKLKN